MTTTRDRVLELHSQGMSGRAIARELGIHHSSVQDHLRRESIDPAIKAGMDALGMDDVPSGGWIKSQEPDENGRTYSYQFRTKTDESESLADRLNDLFSDLPAVKLPKPKKRELVRAKAFIPCNDLHAGAYAWSRETGYGDWDIEKAVDRLTNWIGQLINDMPPCEECILFYNGDTLHTNGEVPMTPASGHILDVDSRHFKVADMAATAIITTAELAAQSHGYVRLVIKRGNHDEDSYLALMLAAKWRFRGCPNIVVEEDPSPFWAHQFGKVFLFGHHGDRVKPQDLVMKMAADHPEAWAASTAHRVVWTAHKHHRQMQQFRGADWEQASCLTDPDSYGAYWGNNALAQGVVYDYDLGEVQRLTVRAKTAL